MRLLAVEDHLGGGSGCPRLSLAVVKVNEIKISVVHKLFAADCWGNSET